MAVLSTSSAATITGLAIVFGIVACRIRPENNVDKHISNDDGGNSSVRLIWAVNFAFVVESAQQ
jgi:hypothetical protein